MAGGVVLGIPPIISELNQKGLLERAFHDGLFPNLAYRAEAMPEEWPANTGQEIVMTRAGLLKPTVTPLTPGSEPAGQTVPYEQWVATLAQFADSIDTHMPTSTTANANLLLRNIHQLGLQAGQSVNRVARDSLFQAYLSGQTLSIAATLTTDTSIRVAALNGFTDVVVPGSNVRPQTVSTAYPLPITIGPSGSTVSANVIGFIPDDGTDPLGPGVLLLAGQIGTVFASRVPVKSAYAPRMVLSAAGDSIDAIGAGDTLTLQQSITAMSFLRRANVQPHDDGFYHAHISALGNAQFFADGVFQRLNQSLPEHIIYKQGFIGQMANIAYFINNEAPETTNVGTLKSTASGAFYAPELGSEIVNGAGIPLGMMIVTGKGSIYEKYLDEGQYVTEAGTTGKIGEFDVVNNGIKILTERIRLVLRAPIDKLQQQVTTSWSISTSFPTPSDITASSGPERFKRAVVCVFAQSL